MSVEFYRESPGKFDSRTLNGETLSRWTGRSNVRYRAVNKCPRQDERRPSERAVLPKGRLALYLSDRSSHIIGVPYGSLN